MGIGKNIKKYRKVKGLTQEKLAELVGVATVTIKKYESNEREPNLTTIDKIAEALEVSRLDLLETTYKINNTRISITEEHINDSTGNQEMRTIKNLLNDMNINEDFSESESKVLLKEIKLFIEFEIYKLKKEREEKNYGKEEK